MMFAIFILLIFSAFEVSVFPNFVDFFGLSETFHYLSLHLQAYLSYLVIIEEQVWRVTTCTKVQTFQTCLKELLTTRYFCKP